MVWHEKRIDPYHMMEQDYLMNLVAIYTGPVLRLLFAIHSEF